MAVVAACLGVLPSAAVAATAPVKPTGIRAVDVTPSGFTVTIANHTGATAYRVYVSSVKSNLYVATIDDTKSFAAKKPTVALTGLKFRTIPYWFRVKTGNGTSHAWSDIYSVSLKPSAPTGVTLTTSSSGTSLTWDAGRSTGFQVVSATDPTLTQDREVHTSRTDVHQFSPYPLTAGTTYYFAVRTQNGSTASNWSPVVSGVAGNSLDHLRVMTYNVLHTAADGNKEGDGVVGSWADRAPGVVALIRDTDPDVIAIQEGAGWVGPAAHKVRQVDDIVRRLGGDYQLVRTEVPPTEPGYFRTGSYVLIRTATVAVVGSGGRWVISEQSKGHAYAELESRQTGARFLFVCTHLSPGNESVDERRRVEMTAVLANAAREAAARGGLPVVYAGDFNSHPTATLPNDAVSVVAKANLLTDAFTGAETLTDASYNSANRYYRKPPATSDSIDHVFTGPGVTVSSFRVVVKLVGGRFSGVIPSDHNPVLAKVAIPY